MPRIKFARDVLKLVKPVTTNPANNQVTFKAAPHMGKIDVKLYLENIYGMKVHNVNSINYDGRLKRYSRNVVKRPNWKKFIVTVDDASLNATAEDLMLTRQGGDNIPEAPILEDEVTGFAPTASDQKKNA